jgi:DNA ligase (NAD+)
VQLAGTTVSRCSLHNAEEIARKDIRVGDVVVVEKAGKIIPHIVRVEKHLRSEALSAFEFPTRCPECQAPLARDLRGVYIRCTSSVCPAQWKQRLRFFASRDCMDIEGLGDKLVSQLVDQKLVTDFATLYGLQEKTVADLERMGDKSARQLIDGIGRSRQAGLARVLHALAIRHVGQRVAQVLADRFRTIDALQEASVQQLASTPEIGPIIAQSVYDYLHGDEGIETMRQLREAGVLLEQPKEAVIPGDGPWSGTTWVVTGTLAKYSRDEIHQTIAALGGKAASSVSKSTSYLVAGEKAGSKLDKANQLGVRVLSEEQFEQMLQKATSGEGSATGKA